MAEWIEILTINNQFLLSQSPLAMAEWIEILVVIGADGYAKSPLAMAEWIEISHPITLSETGRVSASDGGVD